MFYLTVFLVKLTVQLLHESISVVDSNHCTLRTRLLKSYPVLTTNAACSNDCGLSLVVGNQH